MFGRMKEEGYVPNLLAYNALLSVCARRGDMTVCDEFGGAAKFRARTFFINFNQKSTCFFCQFLLLFIFHRDKQIHMAMWVTQRLRGI